ncbi:hypothetical protein NESM_000400100 [Novymonas esmeraldas]|uniref:Uncharacterized protein n=1 Tax=Novymonas esmeraldas TaxID=1808958 RepID=A0AAW0EMW1_9TRYP
MSTLATLRAANCTRLLHIRSDVVAACGDTSASVIQYTESFTKVAEATCAAPRAAYLFTPWLAPGAPVAEARAVWCVAKDGVHAVLTHTSPAAAATTPSQDATPTVVVDGLPDRVVGLRIVHQTMLAVCTATSVRLYSLDAASSASPVAAPMGECELPPWAAEPGAVIDVAAPACASATEETTVCVACFTQGRAFATLLVCTSSASAAVVRRTPAGGVPLPASSLPAPAGWRVGGWVVRWKRQELLVLCSSATETATRLAALSLRPTDQRELSRWLTPAELTASLGSAVTPAKVPASRDLCSDHDGEHVWLCDAATGPAVVLREVTATPMEERVLKGVTAKAQVVVASGAGCIFVLAGRTLYAVASGRSGTASESAAAAAPLQCETGTTSVAAVGGAHVRDAVLRYVLGTATGVSFVVRDAVYVRESGGVFTHAILSAIDTAFIADRQKHAVACVRYASVAQSLHPYTVLELLHGRRFAACDEAPVAGLLFALASALAGKPTLQHGGLQRLPAFGAASAAFFAVRGGGSSAARFASDVDRKQYVADVCSSATAALASGSLGAARLLFAVADRAVSLLYGGTAAVTHTHSAAELQCEAVIADSISVMRSFVDWSLTASSSIGVMSAHFGASHSLTKEAALRDGLAHPIDTSRQVHIRAVPVLRQPKRSI